MARPVTGVPHALPRAPLYAVEVLLDGRWERAGVPASWERVAREWAARLTRRYERVRIRPIASQESVTRAGRDTSVLPEIMQSFSDDELTRRGIVRAGLGLRAASDRELDVMWQSRRSSHQPPGPTLAPGATRASLALEFRGHDVWSLVHPRGMRPWVARLIGREREFLHGAVDFLHADELGGEGVYLWYVLDAGETYEIYDRARPAGPRRRLVEVVDGQIETVAVRA